MKRATTLAGLGVAATFTLYLGCDALIGLDAPVMTGTGGQRQSGSSSTSGGRAASTSSSAGGGGSSDAGNDGSIDAGDSSDAGDDGSTDAGTDGSTGSSSSGGGCPGGCPPQTPCEVGMCNGSACGYEFTLAGDSANGGVCGANGIFIPLNDAGTPFSCASCPTEGPCCCSNTGLFDGGAVCGMGCNPCAN